MRSDQLKTFHEETHQTGYDREEEYFQRRNREWIAELQAAREAMQRSAEATARRREHWRKCPECGADLSAMQVGGHHGLVCAECKSVTLPLEELADVIKTKEPHSWLEGFKTWLIQAWKPHPTGIHHIPV
jgi:hypothetical protein